MRTYTKQEIQAVIDPMEVIAAIEEGFVAFSRGEVTVPPVGHLKFEHPPGDTHIKYGYRHGDSVFVVKIASGFYENPDLGLSSSSGMMIVFSSRTGFPEAILLDEGYLTDLRTAAAGAVAAKYLAPKNVSAIGIIGAGIQARMQLDMLRHVTPCRNAVVWARTSAKARAFAVEGFDVDVATSTEEVMDRCNLIVTATPAEEPILMAGPVPLSVHITAVGADAPGKQELDPNLFACVSVAAVDSRQQCFAYGEAKHAIKSTFIGKDDFVELGEIIANPALGRTNDRQSTIADLTGLAIQDIQIAKLVCAKLGSAGNRPT